MIRRRTYHRRYIDTLAKGGTVKIICSVSGNHHDMNIHRNLDPKLFLQLITYWGPD